MLFYMGILCTLLTSSFVYSNQALDSEVATIQTDLEEEDYSDLKIDLELLEEEDNHTINW